MKRLSGKMNKSILVVMISLVAVIGMQTSLMAANLDESQFKLVKKTLFTKAELTTELANLSKLDTWIGLAAEAKKQGFLPVTTDKKMWGIKIDFTYAGKAMQVEVRLFDFETSKPDGEGAAAIMVYKNDKGTFLSLAVSLEGEVHKKFVEYSFDAKTKKIVEVKEKGFWKTINDTMFKKCGPGCANQVPSCYYSAAIRKKGPPSWSMFFDCAFKKCDPCDVKWLVNAAAQ